MNSINISVINLNTHPNRTHKSIKEDAVRAIIFGLFTVVLLYSVLKHKSRIMFDKNRNLKVGRDINIQINESNYENLDTEKLIQKKSDSNLILRKENKKKIKRAVGLFVFASMLFFILYVGIPFLFENYGSEDNVVINFLTIMIPDEKTKMLLSGIASFMTILNPISNLWKSNEIEKKQYEILKSINTILKEREYLKNSTNGNYYK